MPSKTTTIADLCSTLEWMIEEQIRIKEILRCLDPCMKIDCPPNMEKGRRYTVFVGGNDRRLGGYCPDPLITSSGTSKEAGVVERRLAGQCPDPVVYQKEVGVVERRLAGQCPDPIPVCDDTQDEITLDDTNDVVANVDDPGQRDQDTIHNRKKSTRRDRRR